MTPPPQTWHYGLVARWWAEFNTEGPEVEYFRTFIERSGTPALDAGCGTGRLLLPYLRAGLDVDGCDVSQDMLTLCQEKAEQESLQPRLYRQALHDLDLPRRYRTIVVCGAFGLGGSRAQDQEALRRFSRHLMPGGTLVLDHYMAYKDEEEWRLWLKEERVKPREPWPEGRSRRRRAANGDEIELRGRVASVDPLDQVLTRQIRAILWRNGGIEREEEYTLIERQYFRNETLDMLAAAGFTEVRVFGDYTDQPATPDSGILIYAARKEPPPAASREVETHENPT
ncbi:MAG TPA: class I SAM-dependent methyltransferase, partial [Anaerolineales bacterium]|nr:class I SAM-dependent methyltransferase [Anaerolineales bacterium]